MATGKSVVVLRSYTAPDDPPDHSVAASLAALERLKNPIGTGRGRLRPSRVSAGGA